MESPRRLSARLNAGGRGIKDKLSSGSRKSRDTIRRELESFLQERVRSGNTYRRREKIVTEIFASERRYQAQLRVVVQVFMNPLRSRGLIPDAAFRTIFGDLTAIQAVNKELLAHMEESSIGSAFLRLAPHMRLYCSYANNFDKAILTLQEWERKLSSFSKFLQVQESKDECRSLTLQAYLITPVQRVPRYKLLLEQLVEHTPPSHEDYKNIKEASQMMAEVTLGINEYIREHENFTKMLSIQQRLTGPETPRILVPGRRFIREGPLMKVSRKGFGAHERMFFLFSDVLIYAKSSSAIERPLSPKSFLCRQVIPLETCTVQLVLGEQKSFDTGALFKVSFGDDHLLLYSPDHYEALGWVEDLKSAVSTHKESTTSIPMETLTVASEPQNPVTPYRYSLRPRQRSKVMDSVLNTPGSQPDSLFPMRAGSLPPMGVETEPKGNQKKSKDVVPCCKTSKTPGPTRKTRTRSNRSFSPFVRKRRRSSGGKNKRKRLERGPLPLKEKNSEDDPAAFHDALSVLPQTTDENDGASCTLMLTENNLPPTTIKRNDPRRRSYKSYEDIEAAPESLGSSIIDQASSCVIL